MTKQEKIREGIARILAKQARDFWWEKLSELDKESYLNDADEVLAYFDSWGEGFCHEHGIKKRRRCDKCWKTLKNSGGEMTKQEKIREGILKIFDGYNNDPAIDWAWITLSFLSSQGVAIKVEGEESEGCSIVDKTNAICPYKGYTAWKPLIGEE